MEKLNRRGFAGACVLLSFILSACGSQNQGNFNNVVNTPNSSSALHICSTLNFDGVTWSSSMTATDRDALKLALNISGSYEGETGWSNLTNNFDNQGLSLGLLNQNLGQGSLQPLLAQMRDHYLGDLQAIFSGAHLQSLLTMLTPWKSTAVANFQSPLSLLDVQPSTPGDLTPQTSLVRTDVQWALSNIYSDQGITFNSTWKAELTSLGANPDYISLQIGAATDMHTQAIANLTTFNIHELRAYLMFFDIAVQDGTLYSTSFSTAAYMNWISQNPMASTTDMLNKILAMRLVDIQSAYQADVQSRKGAIINGSGVVHRVSRNLETQYCFQRLMPYH